MKTTTLLKLVATVLLIVASAAFLAACSDSDDDGSPAGDAAEHVDDSVDADGDTDEHADDGADDHDDEADDHSDEADDHSDGDDHDAVEVVVTLTDQLTFEPNEITVEAGQSVRLVLENTGLSLHDFTIEEMEAHVSHAEGGSEDPDHADDHEAHTEAALHLALDGHAMGTLEFTPEEPGEYVFLCTVEGHAQNGMTGTLIVTEA